MTNEQKYYERGMVFLSSPVSKKDSKTLVELYTDLQKEYTDAVSAKAHAFREAREQADATHGKDAEEADAAFKGWLDENARAWRNRVQAAYMNWVVTGKKEEVEFWFAVVDKDTAMSRIEMSKVRQFSSFFSNSGAYSFPGNYAVGSCAGRRRFLRIPKGETGTS